jgi:hypothetical protein
MPEATFLRNLKKWFWGFLLGQLIITVGSFLFFTGSLQKAVDQHDEQIKDLKVKVESKADVQMVLRIKLDNDRIQQLILDDVKYIRQRIDEHMANDKK